MKSDITDQDIIDAGRALAAAGKKVTPRAIIKKLGSGGYERVRRVWEANGKVAEEAPPEAPLPEELAAAVEAVADRCATSVSAMGRELFVAALAAAEGRIGALLDSEREARRSAEGERDDVRRYANDLEEQLAEHVELRESHQALIVANERAGAECALLRRRCDEQVSSLARLSDDLGMARTSLATQSAQLEEFRRRCADAEAMSSEWRRRHDEVEARLAQVDGIAAAVIRLSDGVNRLGTGNRARRAPKVAKKATS